jgi:hypothetical protein
MANTTSDEAGKEQTAQTGKPSGTPERQGGESETATAAAEHLVGLIQRLSADYDNTTWGGEREAAEAEKRWAAITRADPSPRTVSAAMAGLFHEERGAWMRALAIRGMTEWLLASIAGGADVNAPIRPNAQTALMFAVTSGHMQTAIAIGPLSDRSKKCLSGLAALDHVSLRHDPLELILAVMPEGALAPHKARELFNDPDVPTSRLDALREWIDPLDTREGPSLIRVALSGEDAISAGASPEAFAWIVREALARDEKTARQVVDFSADLTAGKLYQSRDLLADDNWTAMREKLKFCAELWTEKFEWLLERELLTKKTTEQVALCLRRCRPVLPRALARHESRELAASVAQRPPEPQEPPSAGQGQGWGDAMGRESRSSPRGLTDQAEAKTDGSPKRRL